MGWTTIGLAGVLKICRVNKSGYINFVFIRLLVVTCIIYLQPGSEMCSRLVRSVDRDNLHLIGSTRKGLACLRGSRLNNYTI